LKKSEKLERYISVRERIEVLLCAKSLQISEYGRYTCEVKAFSKIINLPRFFKWEVAYLAIFLEEERMGCS
jgi:hypothetical protein